jgi:hypothetical protein
MSKCPMSSDDQDALRRERIQRYQDNAARERLAAERTADPEERQRRLRLASGWKRLEDIENRGIRFEAILKDAYDRQAPR